MVDWKKYYEEFPLRYVNYGFFDVTLETFIRRYGKDLVAVDIGGGIGTARLRNSRVKTWLLDPYVNKREWMAGSICWEEFMNSPGRFDIAVLRGSINYLNRKQIESIPKVCQGFIANSFERPKEGWRARRYESISSNGIELSNYSKESNKIQHILVDDNMRVIEHSFNVYGSEYFKELIPDVKIERYNKNSLLLTHGICNI